VRGLCPERPGCRRGGAGGKRVLSCLRLRALPRAPPGLAPAPTDGGCHVPATRCRSPAGGGWGVRRAPGPVLAWPTGLRRALRQPVPSPAAACESPSLASRDLGSALASAPYPDLHPGLFQSTGEKVDVVVSRLPSNLVSKPGFTKRRERGSGTVLPERASGQDLWVWSQPSSPKRDRIYLLPKSRGLYNTPVLSSVAWHDPAGRWDTKWPSLGERQDWEPN